MSEEKIKKIVLVVAGVCGVVAGYVAYQTWFSESGILIALPILLLYGFCIYCAAGYGILKLVRHKSNTENKHPKRTRKKVIDFDKFDFTLPGIKMPHFSSVQSDLPFHELLICAVGLATLACGYHCLQLLFDVPALTAVGSRIMPAISAVAACFALLSILRHVVPFLRACLSKLTSRITQEGGTQP